MDTNKSTLRIKSAMPKILVVEDDELLQLVMQSYLEKAGYACDIVGSGCDAVEYAIANEYQIIFMDLNLPDIDGFETAYRIRGLKKHYKKALVIALTSQNFNLVSAQCVKAQMDLFICKPISYAQLEEVISSYEQQGRNSCLHLSSDCGITQLAVLG